MRAGFRAKRTGPRLGWMGSNRLLVFRRVIPRVAAGIALGAAGRGFGVAKAFLAGLFAGRTDWSFAGAAGFTLSARFASRGFSTALVFVSTCLHNEFFLFLSLFFFFFFSRRLMAANRDSYRPSYAADMRRLLAWGWPSFCTNLSF